MDWGLQLQDSNFWYHAAQFKIYSWPIFAIVQNCFRTCNLEHKTPCPVREVCSEGSNDTMSAWTQLRPWLSSDASASAPAKSNFVATIPNVYCNNLSIT